jgi:hypothetical protein
VRNCFFRTEADGPWRRGRWHCWQQDTAIPLYRESVGVRELGPGPYPAAVVEDTDGSVHIVRASLVSFGDPARAGGAASGPAGGPRAETR